MKLVPRSITLFTTLAVGSFALGAVTTTKMSTAQAKPHAVRALPASSGDPSVPPASTVNFPADESEIAPTF